MDSLWENVVKFHGHECPGLAIGFKAALTAKELLECCESEDEEIVCIAENDACGLDAIQCLLKCTVGKGNLIIRLTGKSVYHFYNRKTGKSVRLSLKDNKNDMDRKEYQDYLLKEENENLFSVSESNICIPETARIFNSLICDKCGEKTAEYFMRIQDNKNVCLDCFNEYKRFYVKV